MIRVFVVFASQLRVNIRIVYAKANTLMNAKQLCLSLSLSLSPGESRAVSHLPSFAFLQNNILFALFAIKSAKRISFLLLWFQIICEIVSRPAIRHSARSAI